MLKIQEIDFRPLDFFPLKWRWTDSYWNKFPDDALNEIQSLTETKALELCQYSLQFESQSGLIKSFFEPIRQVNADAETSAIQRWLFAHQI